MSRPLRTPGYQQLSPPHWTHTMQRAFLRRVETGRWAHPARCRSLERCLARMMSVDPAWVMATNSCTAALAAAYQLRIDTRWAAWRNWEGSTAVVRVCPLTFPATYAWPLLTGMRVIWVDCDDDGWPAGPVDVGVDLWGRACPARPLEILDAAHRAVAPEHGAGLKDGSLGAVCYSFGAQKQVASPAWGGALVCPLLQEASARAEIEAFLTSGKGNPKAGGIKGYMLAPSADAIMVGLHAFDRTQQTRRKVLDEYYRWFGEALLTKPGEASGHLCVVRLQSLGHKLLVMKRLQRLSIPYSTHYNLPEEQKIACPRAAALTDCIITVPCHSGMTPRDCQVVSRAVLTAG